MHTWNEHRTNSSGFKAGRWNAVEDHALLERFDDYCAMHSLEGDARLRPLVETAKGSPEQDVWRYCAEGFKHRTLRSVMRRAIRLLHPSNHKGEFSEEERALVVQLVAKHGPAWKTIGRIMGRFPPTLAVLWTRIGGGDATVTGLWSASEEALLLELVVRHGERNPATGGYTNVPWTVVARELGTRTPGQVLAKWNSGFAERRLGQSWTAADDLALATAVLADGGEARDEVYWHELLPGRLAADCRRRFDQLAKRLPHHDQMAFADKAERLVVDLTEAAAAAAAAKRDAETGRFSDLHARRRKGRRALPLPASEADDRDGLDAEGPSAAADPAPGAAAVADAKSAGARRRASSKLKRPAGAATGSGRGAARQARRRRSSLAADSEQGPPAEDPPARSGTPSSLSDAAPDDSGLDSDDDKASLAVSTRTSSGTSSTSGSSDSDSSSSSSGSGSSGSSSDSSSSGSTSSSSGSGSTSSSSS